MKSSISNTKLIMKTGTDTPDIGIAGLFLFILISFCLKFYIVFETNAFTTLVIPRYGAFAPYFGIKALHIKVRINLQLFKVQVPILSASAALFHHFPDNTSFL